MGRVIGIVKKYLIPCGENDHQPYLLRRQAVVFVCMLLLVAEALFVINTSIIIPRSKLFGLILVNALVDGTNKTRIDSNLSPLRESPLLNVAAQQKANDMVKNGYFAHTSPAGVSPWYWIDKAGYRFTMAGENLAVNFSDSRDVVNAWLNSPGHRANILNAGFTEIGMAIAQGEFDGHPAVYVVELFGKPAPVFATAAVAASPAKKVALAPVPAPVLATSAAPTSAVPSVVLSADVTSVPQTNAIQRAAADPRRVVNYFYLAIIFAFAAALLFDIFIKIHVQYSQSIIGGMVVMLIAGLFFILNQYFASAGVVVF